jgi:DNA-directed RNA polymerase specialized sigma subunit
VNVDDVRILAEHALITAASSFRQDYQGQDYCTPVKFRQYASKAVYGACLMGYRQRNYLEATHGDLDQAENREDPGEHLDDGVKRNQWCVIVRWAIGMLDDRGSKIVEWHHIEGMQLIEVAARIGLTPKWTGVLHARALRQIEALLAMRGIRGVE